MPCHVRYAVSSLFTKCVLFFRCYHDQYPFNGLYTFRIHTHKTLHAFRSFFEIFLCLNLICHLFTRSFQLNLNYLLRFIVKFCETLIFYLRTFFPKKIKCVPFSLGCMRTFHPVLYPDYNVNKMSDTFFFSL